MDAAELNSNQQGGSEQFRSMISEAKRLAPAQKRKCLEEARKGQAGWLQTAAGLAFSAISESCDAISCHIFVIVYVYYDCVIRPYLIIFAHILSIEPGSHVQYVLFASPLALPSTCRWCRSTSWPRRRGGIGNGFGRSSSSARQTSSGGFLKNYEL